MIKNILSVFTLLAIFWSCFIYGEKMNAATNDVKKIKDIFLFSEKIVLGKFNFNECKTKIKLPQIIYAKIDEARYIKGTGKFNFKLRMYLTTKKEIQYLCSLTGKRIFLMYGSEYEVNYPINDNIFSSIHIESKEILRQVNWYIKSNNNVKEKCSFNSTKNNENFSKINILLERLKKSSSKNQPVLYEKLLMITKSDIRSAIDVYVNASPIRMTNGLSIRSSSKFESIAHYSPGNSQDVLDLVFSMTFGVNQGPLINGGSLADRQLAKDRWLFYFYNEYPGFFKCN